MRYLLAGKAIVTSADLNGLNLITNEKGEQIPKDIVWNGKLPGFAQHLRTWGEAGTVKLKTKATPKIADRGKQCMLVGYAKDHAGDCYRMYNPTTKGRHLTHDVIWLNRMFYTSRPDEVESIEVALPIKGNVDTFDMEGLQAEPAEEPAKEEEIFTPDDDSDDEDEILIPLEQEQNDDEDSDYEPDEEDDEDEELENEGWTDEDIIDDEDSDAEKEKEEPDDDSDEEEEGVRRSPRVSQHGV